MINKHNECDIVSDLLPLYVEHRTSEACNVFIREHLEQCEECRGELEFMEAAYEEFLDEGRTGGELSESGWPSEQGIVLPKRGQLPEQRKMRLKSKRRAKWKIFVGGYVLLLAGIWLYLIFGLFWGVM